MTNEKRLIDPNDFLDLFYVASAGQDKAFIKVVEMVVEDTPTVDAVEVVHAHWEDGCAVDPKTGRIIYKSIDCSHCNEIFKTDDREYWKARFKVCPFCGAKMDGGNEDV